MRGKNDSKFYLQIVRLNKPQFNVSCLSWYTACFLSLSAGSINCGACSTQWLYGTNNNILPSEWLLHYYLKPDNCIWRPSPYRAVNTVSVIKTSQLILYREIIAAFSEIHTIHINTVCGQNVELLNVKLVVHIVTTGL